MNPERLEDMFEKGNYRELLDHLKKLETTRETNNLPVNTQLTNVYYKSRALERLANIRLSKPRTPRVTMRRSPGCYICRPHRQPRPNSRCESYSLRKQTRTLFCMRAAPNYRAGLRYPFDRTLPSLLRWACRCSWPCVQRTQDIRHAAPLLSTHKLRAGLLPELQRGRSTRS